MDWHHNFRQIKYKQQQLFDSIVSPYQSKMVQCWGSCMFPWAYMVTIETLSEQGTILMFRFYAVFPSLILFVWGEGCSITYYYLCLKGHVFERHGWDQSTVQRWESNSLHRQRYDHERKYCEKGPEIAIFLCIYKTLIWHVIDFDFDVSHTNFNLVKPKLVH